MIIDVSADNGIEELEVIFCIGEASQKQKIDIFELADKLSSVFNLAVEKDMRKNEAWPLLKAEWERVGFKIPEQGFNMVYAASQRLLKSCVDRKKKFDDNLWGIGDEWPASPAFTTV